MRGFRDRDYLRTEEGYFFCVLGPVHPEDRVIAYLKYVPDPSGKWGRGSNRFRRALPHYTVDGLLETFRFLESRPEYLFELSGVPPSYFGVTGSVLLDIHRDFSDIDLLVYGKRNSESVRKALLQSYEERDSPVRRLHGEKAREWCLQKTELYPLTYEEAERILERRWNRGLFHGTLFSIHPVKLEGEVKEKYGDRVFRPEGTVKIEATVSDASEACFMPATYRVEDVRVVEGPRVRDIFEVVSYEGLYGDLAKDGERILAYGKLEGVTDRVSGLRYHRLLIGSQEARGRDYIKLLS
ncbi:hypothetical protein B6U84_04865 [Candidatus Bathyarchaeota archaeon ex4484_40]|nr:MAG: hypothetical protein B6U84_04865 [Candidatus Bathyarchaeota archaeon ex4484_40]